MKKLKLLLFCGLLGILSSCQPKIQLKPVQIIPQPNSIVETEEAPFILDKKARIVISSGGVEPVLDSGGSGGHSVFASALLDTLSSNSDIIDTTSLFSQIRMKVSWNAEQVPELGIIHKAGHEGGDFFFVPKGYWYHWGLIAVYSGI